MKYAFVGATVLDGTLDMKPLKNFTVLVEDGKITGIKSGHINLDDYKVIDLSGKYLMPGLINLHVHLPGNGMPKDTKKQNAESVKRLMSNPITRYAVYTMCKNYAQQELMSGVTTIRTVGGVQNIDTTIRNKVNAGKIKGPRILASNMAVSVPNGHMAGVLAHIAYSPEDCVKYVRLIAQDKPDLIKIMITGGVLDAKVKGEPGELKMPLEFVKACCDEAHLLGYKVAAHVESPEGVKVALEGGVDTIEHGAKPNEEIIKLFKEHKSAHICTISPAIPLGTFDESVMHSDEVTRYNGKIVLDGIIECAKACLNNGVTVGLGTDTACPYVTHYDTWRELAYFEKFVGVSKSFALHTATQVNAQIAGIDHITGTIELGKCADFLITEENPLENLQALRNPYMVVANGKIYNSKIKKYEVVENALDSVLEE